MSCQQSGHQRLTELAERRGIHSADFALPRREFFESDGGLRLHFVDWQGNGPPILFLHGGMLSAQTWDLVCLGLRAEYRCVALDLRGHGDSDWAQDYAVPSFVADVGAMADHLGWQHFHIVGMSLGGIVAGHCAAAAPDRIASLTMVDVGPKVDFAATGPFRHFVSQIDRAPSIRAVVEAALEFSPRLDRGALEYRMTSTLRQLPDGTWTWKHDRRRPHDYAHLLAMLDQLAVLARKIPCPALIVRGARSRIFSNTHAADFAGRFFKGTWISIAGAGHNVQEDNPAGLVGALRRFLPSGSR